MKAQGRGRIVNIASAHGLVASAFKAPYVAAKHGVVGFTKACAVELARKKLRGMQRLDLDTRKRRLYGLLARRGFNPDTISSVMAELADEIQQGCKTDWD